MPQSFGKEMKPAYIIAASMVVAICGCKDDASIDSGGNGQEQVAHEITAIAIVQKVSFGEIKRPYVLQEKPSLSIFALGEDEAKAFAELEELLADVEEIGPKLAAKFIAANRDPKSFQKDSFPTEFPVVLLSDAKMKELFAESTEDGWQQFYEDFDSFGIVTASQPVFAEDGKSALIMIWHQYGPLQGGGGFVMAKRIGNSWTAFDLTSAPSGVSSVPNKRVDTNRLLAASQHDPLNSNP
ncbi:MAG: hypothetical protein AAF357_05580 [Verrucomicrobiota bacterium]